MILMTRGCAVLGWVPVFMAMLTVCGAGCTRPTEPTTTPTPIVLVGASISVSGTVTDGETRLGIAGATVSIGSGTLTGATRTTDTDGRYNLQGIQVESSFTLNVTATDYAPSSRVVSASPNSTQDFALVPTGCKFAVTLVETGIGISAWYTSGPGSLALRVQQIRGSPSCDWVGNSTEVGWVTLTPRGTLGNEMVVVSLLETSASRCAVVFLAGSRINILQHPSFFPAGQPFDSNFSCESYWSRF